VVSRAYSITRRASWFRFSPFSPRQCGTDSISVALLLPDGGAPLSPQPHCCRRSKAPRWLETDFVTRSAMPKQLIKIMKARAGISPDRSKIVLDSQIQVRHWTKHLGVTQQELARAIERVGSSAAAVRKELAFKTASESK